MTYFDLRRRLLNQNRIDMHLDMMAGAPEHIQHGLYAYLSIVEDMQLFGGQILMTSALAWEGTFAQGDPFVFIYGNPYAYLQNLRKTEYEIAIFAYIKRTELFYKLTSAISDATREYEEKHKVNNIKARFDENSDFKSFIIEFDSPSNPSAFMASMESAIKQINTKYSFLKAEYKALKRKDTLISYNPHIPQNAQDEMILVQIAFTKHVTKNVKLDAEYKRLLAFDAIEAAEHIYRHGIFFEDTEVMKSVRKNTVVENLARYYYPENPLESAKNQIYKLYREAKLRVFEDGLEQYF